tara:strand:- start:1089 stop:2645 length:1557 start_codon:yes stop_codon:yes gene_type:complete
MQYEGLINYHHVDDDTRYLFFINNFPDSLENNILAQNSYGKGGSTTIYFSNFYIIAGKFIDFIILGKLMGIFAFLLSVVFIYKLGKIIKNKRYALILTFLFILQPWLARPFQGGLSRSFAFPLLIASIYYLIKKDRLKLSFVFLLEALIYPPVFLISLFTYGISLIDLKEKRINLALNKNYIVFIFIMLSFALILVPMLSVNYGIGEGTTLKEAIYSPEFYDGGAVPIFTGSIPFTSDIKSTIQTLILIYNFGINRPVYLNTLVVLFILSVVFIISYGKQIFKLPKEIYFLPIASLILQSLAFLLLFKLHIPSRYVKFSIPLFLIIILAHGIYLLSIQKKLKHIFAILLLILAAFYINKLILIPQYNPIYCADKDIYGYLKTLPNDALIAGHPVDMNCIALFGQKNPFVMSQLHSVLFKDYYRVTRQRDFDFFSAYYAENKLEIQEFCKKNGITHIVVNKEHFTKEYLNQDYYYSEAVEPFNINKHIKNLTKNKKEFYFMEPENIVYKSDSKIIVSCE